MSTVLEQYIDPAYVYRFTNGPDVVRTREDAVRLGLNCVSLAHLALRDLFGCRLPEELLCMELFRDNEHFEPVELDSSRLGDLAWFGLDNPRVALDDFVPRYTGRQLANWPDFPVKHVGIFTGKRDEKGDPLVLHSSHIAGTNVIWPLTKFAEHKRYRKLYGATRLKIPADIITPETPLI